MCYSELAYHKQFLEQQSYCESNFYYYIKINACAIRKVLMIALFFFIKFMSMNIDIYKNFIIKIIKKYFYV